VRRLPGYGSYFPAYFAGAPRVEAALGAWGADYPTPSSMLGVLACLNSPYSCDPAVDRKLRETLELQTRNPQAANETWARLERGLIDQAIVVPVISPKLIGFVSKRVGNYQHHPVFGMLISQVWVR
jgi:peptide/nickel transport system substrate-binding protein